MKLKKFLLILLAAVSCACIGFAFGCKDEPVDNPVDDRCTVNFELSEHIMYVIDGEEVPECELKVDKETTVRFSVVVEEGFLAETLVVKDDAGTLAAIDGVYSYKVMKDATITATVAEDLLDVDKDGVYLISSLKDLCFVADMVNSGYPNYVMGEYKLENDIDCGGAKLDVIGSNDQYGFFSGIFDGQGHTISNYKITTVGQTYVGLFGCVQISTRTTNVIIQNLNLKDFTISATAADDGNVIVGGIAAVVAGANVVACSAEGVINVYGSGYFSYAGGAVGIQQSLTIADGANSLNHYHSSTEYVHTDVYIVAGSGYVLASGGVVGYAVSSHERATSMVLNCYAEGDILGAMRSGGVVGMLGDYSSIANCYSTGFCEAAVSFENTGSEIDDEDYFAYAGGIVAYAGVETTVSDSFTTCMLNAEGLNTEQAMGDIYAYASPATEFVNSITVFNSYANCEPLFDGAVIDSHATTGVVKPTDASFIKDTLKWNDTDWVIKDGAYPATNLSQGDVGFKLTLNYVGNTVNNGEKTSAYSVSISDSSYFSFSSYFGNYFKEIIVADTAGHTSYGFFFDEACTQRVHYSYVPTRDITIYVGFANYSEVEGTYEFEQTTGRTVKLILNTDATYSYVDVMSFDGTYVYDGDKLIFNDALFARLSTAENAPQPWLNYEPYKFVGTVDGNKLSVYDGVYFTNEIVEEKDNRLAFTKAGEQSDNNSFIGTWERSATINEKYTFNSDMTWSYSWKGDNKSGKYSVNNGVATLTNTAGNTEIATASLDNSGLLRVTETGKNEKYFCLENSFYGNWYSSKNGDYLVLDGCGNGYAGGANAIIDGTVYDNLAYVKDGFFDALTSNNPYTYTIISGYSLFGYFTYDAEKRVITAELYDAGNSDWIEYNFILLDYYLGEWIGEEKVDDVPFTIMDFNGLGLYKAEGDAKLGYIIINGTKVYYDCSVATGLDIQFNYEGKDYVLSTNGDGTITVSSGGNSANLYRKDEMASTPLVDRDDNVYEFSGGGLLSKGGILTKKSAKGVIIAEYRYKIISGSIDGAVDKNGNVVRGYDIIINLYESSVDGDVIGTVEISYPKFVLKLNGQKDVSLDLYFAFAGKSWSISGLRNSFRIGKFDLTYTATGTYNGQNNIPFDYYPEYNYIRIYYGNGFDGYVLNYLLLLDDNNLIVSSYPYFVSSDQWYYASSSDEFVGQWENTVTGTVLEFNGCADSKYSVGEARESNGLIYSYTRRFGTLYMWIEDGENVVLAYTVNYYQFDDELSGDNIYRKPNISFGRIELTVVDDILGQPIKTATDKDGTEYEFNFDGTVNVGDRSGTYLINSVDGDKTTVEITIDGKVITVEVSHSDNGTATVID